MALDAVRMELFYEKQTASDDQGPVISKQPLSSDLFDALFPDKN